MLTNRLSSSTCRNAIHFRHRHGHVADELFTHCRAPETLAAQERDDAARQPPGHQRSAHSAEAKRQPLARLRNAAEAKAGAFQAACIEHSWIMHQQLRKTGGASETGRAGLRRSGQAGNIEMRLHRDMGQQHATRRCRSALAMKIIFRRIVNKNIKGEMPTR